MRTETFTATDGQLDFVLADNVVGSVIFTRNGQTLPTTAYTVSSNTVTFVPAGTGTDINAADATDSTMRAGDLITIVYNREVQ